MKQQTEKTSSASREADNDDIRAMSKRTVHQHLQRLERELSARSNEVDELRRRNTELQEQLVAIRQSTSWKKTRPVRAVRFALGVFRSFARRAFATFVRIPAAASIRFVLRRPGIRRLISAITRRVPWLHARLARFARSPQLRANTRVAYLDASRDAVEARLAVSARRVYRRLQELQQAESGHN